MSRSYVGDTGTQIRLETGVDVSYAESVAIHYKKPNGTTGTWNAIADGTEVVHTTVASDWDVAGWWQYQAYIVNLDGWTGRGEVVNHDVYSRLYY